MVEAEREVGQRHHVHRVEQAEFPAEFPGVLGAHVERALQDQLRDRRARW